MVRIEVHGQRLARIRMDGESLGDWQIRGEGILGRRCLCGTVSTPKGHRQSVRTGDVNRDWIIGRIRELEASAQARVVTNWHARRAKGVITMMPEGRGLRERLPPKGRASAAITAMVYTKKGVYRRRRRNRFVVRRLPSAAPIRAV